MIQVIIVKNNNQINIDGNKKCDINVVVNQPDELSLDNINHNYQDVARIEELFTDRLDIGTDILTKKLLPKQLQKDFEIVPKYNGNKVSVGEIISTGIPDSDRNYCRIRNNIMRGKDIKDAILSPERKNAVNPVSFYDESGNRIQDPYNSRHDDLH